MPGKTTNGVPYALTTDPVANYPSTSKQLAEIIDRSNMLIADWVNLPLNSPWKPYVGGGDYYSGLRARKTPLGVMLQGMIIGGSKSTDIAFLPSALTPTVSTLIPVQSQNEYGCIKIGTNGQVHYYAGPTKPSFIALNLLFPLD